MIHRVLYSFLSTKIVAHVLFGLSTKIVALLFWIYTWPTTLNFKRYPIPLFTLISHDPLLYILLYLAIFPLPYKFYSPLYLLNLDPAVSLYLQKNNTFEFLYPLKQLSPKYFSRTKAICLNFCGQREYNGNSIPVVAWLPIQHEEYFLEIKKKLV